MTRWSILALGVLAVGCGTDTPATATLHQVSTDGARDLGPSYSPDGSQVAFWRVAEEGSVLWVADADLQNARTLPVTTVFGGVPPVWSADGSALAVVSSRRSTADVVMVDLATDSVRYLTESAAIQIPTQFHPDGDRVVFVAFAPGGTVSTFTVSRSTREVRPLFVGLEDPAYGAVSPDGSHVAYVNIAGGAQTVWVSDADGGNRRQLTTDGFEAFNSGLGVVPWSPDGTAILYTTRRTGKTDIWVASLDGTTRQLTSDINADDDPVWSPDGRWVAFTSDRGRQRDIWVVPASGGEPIRVTDDERQESGVRWVDAATLAYSANRSPATLWRRALDDTTTTRLLPDSLDVGDFWPSPDRRWLAFLIDHPGGNNDLAVMRMDGSDLRVVSTDAAHQSVVWSAAGDRIAWASDQGSSVDVYVASVADPAPPERLQDWPGLETPAYWAPDGSAVMVTSDRETRLGDLWRVPVDGGDPVRLSRIGSITSAAGYRMGDSIHPVVVVPDQRTGELTLAEWQAGDRLRTIATGVGGGLQVDPANSLLAVVVVIEGRPVIRVVRPDGTLVHTIDPAFGIHRFSRDGRTLLFVVQVAGQSDLAGLDLGSGEVTRLTSSPDNETHAAFTAGGDSLVIRRVTVTNLLTRADLSAILR